MSNRYITIVLLGIVLLFFIVYFGFQKAFLPSGQPISGLLKGVIYDANHNEWTKAVEKTRRIETEWEKYKYLVMLNYSEADYQIFEDAVYQLAVGAQTKERYEIIRWARASQKLWENFLKIIPEP